MQTELIAVGTGIIGWTGIMGLLYRALDLKIIDVKKEVDKKAGIVLCNERHIEIGKDKISIEKKMDSVIESHNIMTVEFAKMGTKFDVFLEDRAKK